MYKILVGLTIIILLTVTVACQKKSTGSYQKISPEIAHRRLQEEKGIILLDVRTKEEYAQKHIPGSILLPVDNIKDGISEVVPDKDSTIFIYCRSGNRSATAAKILAEQGYTKVFDFGGIIDWKYETQP